MKVYDQISKIVDKKSDNIINFLCEYINHKSINTDRSFPDEPGDVSGCQNWLKEQLVNMDVFDKVDIWEEEKGRPNVVAIIYGEDKRKSIMFNGHSDVVPVTKKQYEDWTIGSPWKAEIINGNIYGRGASDMKGGITSFIWAVKILKENKIPIKGDIILAINIGEESQNTEIGSRSIVKRGYRADFLINAEPTNLRICPSTVGWFFFKITTSGKPAHVAYNRQAIYPTQFGEEITGVNAIEKMELLLNSLKHLNNQWGLYRKHKIAQLGTMNLCLVHINGGKYFSSIPDSCEAIYGVSFNPDLESREVIGEIKNVIKNAAACDYWLSKGNIEIEIPYLEIDKNVVEPINTPKDHKGCIVLAKAYNEIMISEAVFDCFPAVCDANALFELGLTSIIFGPGDLSMGTHAANEYIPVEQLIDATKIYADFIVNWAEMA